jgi:flagellar biosynthesis protein FlhA
MTNKEASLGSMGIGLGVLALVAFMLVPVPAALLSGLLVLNLGGAMLLLVLALTVEDPLQFASFPTTLLLATLMDLALNISATRLILLNGDAGGVIHAFGALMAGSSPLVGLVIFFILTVVQFVVITKGAERVAEVAARFTLDALPGKQMSIDADLSAGLITATEARARRVGVEQEADFYGTMDGASKFSKGNVIASLVILVINLLGGIVAGLVQGHMTFAGVLQHYTILTIGEGLAAQVPALLLSTATGIMVTRVAAGADLGDSIRRQVIARPRALQVVGGVLLLIAVVGFWLDLPPLPFALFGVGAILLSRAAPPADAASSEPAAALPREEPVLASVDLPAVELRLGLALLPLLDQGPGGGLAKRLPLLRQNLSKDCGLPIPEMKVRDGAELGNKEYLLLLRGVEAARGELQPGHYLAMGLADGAGENLGGIPAREPTYDLPARWIPDAARAQALRLGATVVDAGSVLATHISETLRQNLHRLISRREVTQMVDQLRKRSPSLVEEVTPALLSLGEVQRVMSLLLEDGVMLRDLAAFFEALSLAARDGKEPERLAEACRLALARLTLSQISGMDRVVKAVGLDPKLEEMMENAEKAPPTPERALKIRTRLQDALRHWLADAPRAVLLTSPKARVALARLCEGLEPKPLILSTREIQAPFKARTMALVGMD